MGDHGLLLLIDIKVLVKMISLQNIVISGAQRPPDVDEVKIFDKDDQAIKHCSFYLNVLWLGHCYQKYWSHYHQVALSIWNNSVLQGDYYDQNFILIKDRTSWLPIWFHIFFNKAFLVLSNSCFTPGVFLFRFMNIQIDALLCS